MDASTVYALGAACIGFIVFVCFLVGLAENLDTEPGLMIIGLLTPIGWIFLIVVGAVKIWETITSSKS